MHGSCQLRGVRRGMPGAISGDAATGIGNSVAASAPSCRGDAGGPSISTPAAESPHSALRIVLPMRSTLKEGIRLPRLYQHSPDASANIAHQDGTSRVTSWCE